MAPDLTRLNSDYQILTELHRSADSNTFLARHLGLNRDVTVTVIEGLSLEALWGYDADAGRLIVLRHQHVVPVIERLWLADRRYAIVHARVRGSSLDQVVRETGPMPLEEVAAALQQVHSALTWARENGIVNRHVTPDELIFQQGSGRVLVSLSPRTGPPRPSDGPNACLDARTIGELAFLMLSGRRVEEVGPLALSSLRPDLPPPLVAQTERLLRCDLAGAAPDIDAYIAQLAPLATADPVATPVEPVAGTVTRETPTPAGRQREAVARAPRRGMSFGARFVTALLVLLVVGLVAMLVVDHRDRPDPRTALAADTTTGGRAEAGEIAIRARQSDSLLASHGASMPQVPKRVSPSAEPAPAAPTTSRAAVPPRSAPNTTTPAVSPPARGTSVIPAPDTRRHEPPRPTTPPLAMPDTATAPRPGTPAAAPTPAPTRAPTRAPTAAPTAVPGGDACNSSSSSDQHRCLMDAINRNDVGLTEVYGQLIAALRRQAHVPPRAPDPGSVQSLRKSQRRWVNDRDVACRRVGSGPLLMRERSACFADQTAKRTRVLQQMLDAVPQG